MIPRSQYCHSKSLEYKSLSPDCTAKLPHCPKTCKFKVLQTGLASYFPGPIHFFQTDHILPRLSYSQAVILIIHLVKINNNIFTLLSETFHICNLLWSSSIIHKVDGAVLWLMLFYRKGTEDQRSQVICSKSHSWQMRELGLKFCAFQNSTLSPLAWEEVSSRPCLFWIRMTFHLQHNNFRVAYIFFFSVEQICFYSDFLTVAMEGYCCYKGKNSTLRF